MIAANRSCSTDFGRPDVVVEPSKFLLLLLCPLLVLAACTSAPTQEMSDARQAISAARDADAQTYAPRSLDSAERLLGDARQSLEAGRFERARDDALAARDAAMKARLVAIVIGETRAALREAEASGAVALHRSESLLRAAEEAARQGDEGRALELARQARRELP